jgi:hypothetical protein
MRMKSETCLGEARAGFCGGIGATPIVTVLISVV